MFSADRGHNVAIHPGRRATQVSDARPLALPALAAAVHVASNAAQAARAKLAAARQASRFVHEDQPTD